MYIYSILKNNSIKSYILSITSMYYSINNTNYTTGIMVMTHNYKHNIINIIIIIMIIVLLSF